MSRRDRALSRRPSASLSTISAVAARASSPAPMTKMGRPPSVSHHTPVCTGTPPAPSSSSPRSRLTTSVLHSPDDSGTSAAARLTRNPSTRSVHHGRSASCPSTRRTTSTGPATCSAPAKRHAAQPESAAASTRTATASPRVTSAPANGPSVGSRVRTTRCTPGRSAVLRPSLSTSAMAPSQRTVCPSDADPAPCEWIRTALDTVQEQSGRSCAPLGANSPSRHPRTR